MSSEFDLDSSIADYLKTMTLFKDIGDYYTVNISCPNTQEGEPFVDRDKLDALLNAINTHIRPITDKPIYVKLAADMSVEEINTIVDACMDHKMEGVVCTNLAKPKYNTEHRPEEYPTTKGLLPAGKGAMSGLPLQRISTNVVRHVYRRTRGKLTKLGRNYLAKNNVLVLEFDKYGVLSKKEFYNKDNMNKLTFSSAITENEIRKENFIYSFLSSIRTKMESKKK